MSHTNGTLLSAIYEQISTPCSIPSECRATWMIQRFELFVRILFYLAKPHEIMIEENYTCFKNLINDCVPVFFVMAFLELVTSRVVNGNWIHPAQVLPNIYSGQGLQTFALAFHAWEFYFYDFVYHKWHLSIADGVDWTTWPAYIYCVIFLDFCYYIFHRCAHEMAIFWTMHQVHHSSDFFNLSIGFRIPHIHDFIHSGLFYVPMALAGIPMHIVFVHKTVNLLYQFWIHTEFVPKMKWVEYIFNTPSLHRVHHARNPRFLDKNYGSLFIIWDRMFGTYQEEDEKCIYGLTKPQRSVNFIYYQYIGWYELYEKFRDQKGWKNKLQCLIKGPGWEPGSPWTGHPEKVPIPDPNDVPQFQPLTWFWQIFLWVDLFFITTLFGLMLVRFDELPQYIFYMAIGFLYLNGYSLAKTLEQSPLGPPLHAVKMLIISSFRSQIRDYFLAKTPIEKAMVLFAELTGGVLFISVLAYIVLHYKIKRKLA